MSEQLSPTEKLQEILSRPLRGLPEDGALGRFRRRVANRLGNLVFERRFDSSPTEVELDHFHPDRVLYEASGWLDLRRTIPRRKIRSTDVFVDFGSGKGRMVYQAATYPFARVIGVEISAKLNDVARQNIARNRQKLACENVEFVTIDAAEFAIPDDMTFAYLYHPFSGPTLEAVIGNIIQSLDRNPRTLTLIYQMPWSEDYILGTSRFELVRTRKRRRRDPRRIAVYASLPAD
jgi:Methyltransferase domain